MDEKMSLLMLRMDIAAIDVEMLSALAKRSRLVQKVKELKKDAQLPARDGGYELEVIERLTQCNISLYPDLAIKRIWEAIFDGSEEI